MLVEEGSQVGRYQLTRRLGAGGFAEVWEAEDQELHRKVAVKLALPDLCARPEFIERFLREARRAASLDHPNIVAIYDFGREGDRPWLVMPIVPGGTLESRLNPLPDQADTLRWLGELAAALDHAHDEGVVHRDVKPQNVLFDRRGRVLLTDFGIAKSREESAALTQPGSMVGTPTYMSPEQALADPDRHPVEAAADQYSLGVLAYRLLAGRCPFEGSGFSLLRKAVQEPAPPPSTFRPSLSVRVDAVFARVLAKRPEDRFESCGAFVTSLGNVLGPGTTPLPATKARTEGRGTPTPSSTPPRGHRSSPSPDPGPPGRQTSARHAQPTPAPKAAPGPKASTGPTPSRQTPARQTTPRHTPAHQTPSHRTPPAEAKSEWTARNAFAAIFVVGFFVALAVGGWVLFVRRGVASPRTGAPPGPPAAARRTLTEERSGVEFALVPAGSFVMGCADGDAACAPVEKPPHEVRIPKALYVARTETTVGHYARFLAATGREAPPRPRFEQVESHPVVSVTWLEAEAFCAWAGGRLPTEAEWEYAARGGRAGTKYPWDGEVGRVRANYGAEECCAAATGGADRWLGTSPVASFPSNGFGLFDMSGNAAEWVTDWFAGSPYDPVPATDPRGPATGAGRGLRGGSWSSDPPRLRVAARDYGFPEVRTDTTGFRCVRDAGN